jgi:PAS domain S-box-containing protein
MSLSNDVIHIIFNNTRHFYGLLDPQGTILELNQRALEVIGLTHDKAVGELHLDVRLVASRGTAPSAKAVLQARQGEPAQLQLQIRGADGGLNTLDLLYTPSKTTQVTSSTFSPRDMTSPT